MKYKWLEELEEGTSHKKILNQVKPSSTVLECGCASGYMTKYMKEKLDCNVYIVEYTPADFEIAKQFAKDGVCGDLMADEWYQKFETLRFDYILFADVLEHLYDPLAVLKKAVSLLKENGTVLVSLPNVGHNDILAKLWHGNWDYTNTGLLDNTHIHFWGKNNLDNFFQNAGLRIIKKDYTSAKSTKTEQYAQTDAKKYYQTFEVLQERIDGEIYQFILTAQKCEYVSVTDSQVIDLLPLDNGTHVKSIMELAIEEKENVIEEKENVIKDKERHIQNLNSEIATLTNSLSWRITAPLRKATTALRSNRYTCLLLKGIKSLKKNGFRVTWAKAKNKMRFAWELKKASNRSLYTKAELKAQCRKKFPLDIKFSILVPLYNTPEKFLREMIQSVLDQTYANWELCLADGSDGEHDDVGRICMEYAQKDKRICYKKLEKNLGISGNTNACIDMSTGDYIALFDHDDLLHPAALYAVMKEICEKKADFIYTDEVTFRDTTKNCFNHHFKPDFAPDTLRSYNYICHLSVFDRKLLEKAGGGFRSEFDGSQDYDLILRLTEQAAKIIHIPQILYYWRSHTNSVAQDISAKPYTLDAAKKALAEHLERCGLRGVVQDSDIPSTYKIAYEVNGKPLVSILIPNKDHIQELRTCLDSIRNKSSYSNWEVIVIENNSTEPSTFAAYTQLQQDKRIRVVKWDGEFNFSAINNFGAQYANGEYILLLNNDIEVITPDWLEQMLMFAQRKDVGAVGTMLYYPDDTVQHAGVILGIGGIAGHSHKYFDRGANGYMSRMTIAQNYSCVTAACLMMRRAVWDNVRGLDKDFAVAFNDVDLCMRIRQAGYLIVWTPYAELYHYESKSRGTEDTPEKQKRFQGEVERFQKRWAKELAAGDPYYNPNLTLDWEDFSLK